MRLRVNNLSNSFYINTYVNYICQVILYIIRLDYITLIIYNRRKSKDSNFSDYFLNKTKTYGVSEMSKEETNIITMKIKYHTETKEDSDRIFQMMVNYNNIVKCTYNYLLKFPKSSFAEISHYQNSLNNIFLDTHFKNSAIHDVKGLINKNEENKVIFGGKKLFLQRCKNKISKEDFHKQKQIPIYRIGQANQKGNTKFSIITEEYILFKPTRNEHILLTLESVGKNYQKRLLELSDLANQKKIPIDFRLDSEYVYISFDLNKLKSERAISEKIKDRYFSIDLNPNYIGYTVIDWIDGQNYKIVDKGCFSLKKLNDYDDSLFGKGFASDSKERKYVTNKREYETIDISHKLVKIANHYHCEYFIMEDLVISPKDNKKGKKFNNKCNNQWDRNLIVSQIKKVCKLNKIKVLEIAPNYSSFIGNLVYRDERLFDPVLSSIEISRRGYEFVHQYIIKDKGIEKNIIFGNFEKDKEVYKQSLEELGVNFPFETFQELYSQIKESKVRYRFPLDLCNYAVFSKNSIRNYQTLYKFI